MGRHIWFRVESAAANKSGVGSRESGARSGESGRGMSPLRELRLPVPERQYRLVAMLRVPVPTPKGSEAHDRIER